ncbi:MAG TPA: PilZ domain-containing protein [Terriglobales bacterium]|nr:PilZ domain-containing protein [Terriglobales bacterium]
MNLKSLLLSSDDKTVRVLRRVLSDLEIEIEHCSGSDAALHRITRQRFEAIIVDCANREVAGNILRATKAAPVNKRALSIILVDNHIGLKGGFELGAHFVLHKPLAVERAKASFRAVRALMKSERRLQMRVPVEIPITCIGSSHYPARTIDLCEGGMAIQFTGRKAKETSLRFAIELPGAEKGCEKLEIAGEVAWEGDEYRAGVRFKDVSDSQRDVLRKWLAARLPEHEPDDPPVVCRLKDLSATACYLTTTSPFPKLSRVILTVQTGEPAVRAGGVVRITHPEVGMGVEFLQSTPEQQEQVRVLTETLRANAESVELHVEPNGLEVPLDEKSASAAASAGDVLVHLFHEQS